MPKIKTRSKKKKSLEKRNRVDYGSMDDATPSPNQRNREQIRVLREHGLTTSSKLDHIIGGSLNTIDEPSMPKRKVMKG